MKIFMMIKMFMRNLMKKSMNRENLDKTEFNTEEVDDIANVDTRLLMFLKKSMLMTILI